MNPRKDSLSEALRELASASPQGAPSEVGASLRDAFARHHWRRRKRETALVTILAVGVASLLAWLWVDKVPRPGTVARQASPATPSHDQASSISPAVVARDNVSVAPAATPAVLSPAKARPKARSRAHAASQTAAPAMATTGDFVVLPMFDPAIPIGQSRMVRLELPGSALQLIGYPVNEELLERRVVTDVLVGQDGVPYAVRLVQTRTTR